MSESTPATAPQLTVYYDGGCPVCSREIATYQRQRGADAVAWVDASSCAAPALGPGLDAQTALARMHVRTADGKLVSGARSFVLLWQALPATRWLGRIAALPPLPWLLEAAYRAFLRLRPLWRSSTTKSAVKNVRQAQGAEALDPITPALWAELRSDHAGETGAVYIYKGILAVSRDPGLREFAKRHGDTESEHLHLIEGWLPANRRSRLLPAWRMAGWLTGALPALVGPKWVFQTIAAVESFVDHHYAQQIETIDSLPAAPKLNALRELLVACQGDEIAHRDEAQALAGAQALSLPGRLWTSLVASGSAAAVTLARRV